jgi:RNA polymerase sigma factor (sigma-70 family)
MDPWNLVNGWVEYYLKNKNKYMNHPNLKAVAVLKMKGLFIDHFRKSKNLTSTTTEERGEIEFEDKSFDIEKNIQINEKAKNTLNAIQKMGEKCKEILLLAADDMDYKAMAKITKVPIGTVMSRLANCRKELRGLV